MKLIDEYFDINLQVNGFKSNNGIKKKKSINFYKPDDMILIILNFFYSIKINEDIFLPFDINILKIKYNLQFSWKNIFKFLSLDISINDLYDLLKENNIKYIKENNDIIKKIFMNIIENTIKKYINNLSIKKVEFKDFNVWTNSSIISMTRKILIPNKLRYLITTGLIKYTEVIPEHIKESDKKLNSFDITKIEVSHNNDRILSRSFDKNKGEIIYIRPLQISTHMLYIMNEIIIFDEVAGLFQDIKSLIVLYSILLQDESDVNDAINLKLINNSTIPFKIIINSLERFASNSNFEIELLHANWINEFFSKN